MGGKKKRKKKNRYKEEVDFENYEDANKQEDEINERKKDSHSIDNLVDEEKTRKIKVKRLKPNELEEKKCYEQVKSEIRNDKELKTVKVYKLSDERNLGKYNSKKKLSINNNQLEEVEFFDTEYKSEYSVNFNKNKNTQEKCKKEKLSKDLFLIKSKDRKRIVTQEYVNYILEKEKIICLNEDLYKYDNNRGYYRILNQHDFGVLIYGYIKQEHKRLIVDYDIGAMYRLMKIQPKIQVNSNDIDNNDKFINCKNCLIDLEREKKYKHSPERILFNSINAELIQDWDMEEFDGSYFNRFIDNITNKDKELKNLIQEIFGYSISSMNNAKKFFIFYGVSNSGKSTILDVLNYIVGEENCSHIPLNKLVEDKYCAELFGKVLNTYNELPDEGLRDLAQIKGLVSDNDRITARRLYGAPFSFKNRSTLIFATNNLPEIKTKLYQDNSALFKRLIIVPFLISVPEEEQDKDLFKKIVNESNLIFYWSLIGLNRFINNDFRFSYCKLSTKFLNEYMEEENLIEAFINERISYKQHDYVFWDVIKVRFKAFAKENEKSLITAKELKFLKKCIENKFGVLAKKVHRDNQNKLGFHNIIMS